MNRPSFKKNKIQEYMPMLSSDDEVDFTLGKDKILDVLEPFAPKTRTDESVDDEISAYNTYFGSRPQARPQPSGNLIKEQVRYTISDGIQIYVDSDLNLSNSELFKIISNALI